MCQQTPLSSKLAKEEGATFERFPRRNLHVVAKFEVLREYFSQ